MHRTRTPYFAFFAINHGVNGWSEIWPLPDLNIVDARATTALLAEARSFLLANEYVLEWASVRRGGVDYVEWAAIDDPLAALPQWGPVHADHVGLLWRFQAEDGKWANHLFRGVDDVEINGERWTRAPYLIPTGTVARPANPATATIPELYDYVLALFRDRTCHLMQEPVDVGGLDYWEQRPWLFTAYRMVSTRNVGSAYRRVSWEPLDYARQPGFTPCGTAVSVLRACYETDCRFFSSGPVQGIRYYWAQPGAATFPYQHIFWALARDKKVDLDNLVDPGEYIGPGARTYQKGLSWGAAPGIAPDGVQVQFLGQTVCPWGSDPETPLFYVIGCDMPVAIHVDDDDGIVDDTAVTWLTGGQYITVVAVSPGHVQFDVDAAAILALVPADTDELVGASPTDAMPGYLTEKITTASGTVVVALVAGADEKFDLDVRDASATQDGIVSLADQDLGSGLKGVVRLLAGGTRAAYTTAFGSIPAAPQHFVFGTNFAGTGTLKTTVNGSGAAMEFVYTGGAETSSFWLQHNSATIICLDGSTGVTLTVNGNDMTCGLTATAPYGVITDPAFSVAGQRGQTSTVTAGGVTFSFRGGIFLGAISPPPPPPLLSVGDGSLSVLLTGDGAADNLSPVDSTGDGSLSVVITGNALDSSFNVTGTGDGSLVVTLTGDGAGSPPPESGTGDGSLSVVLAGNATTTGADIDTTGDGSLVVTLTGDGSGYADPATGTGDGSLSIVLTGNATTTYDDSQPAHWYKFDEGTGTNAEDDGYAGDIDVTTVDDWDTTGLPYVAGGNAGAAHLNVIGPTHDSITFPGDLFGSETKWTVLFWVKYDDAVGSGLAPILSGDDDPDNLRILIDTTTGEVSAGRDNGADYITSTGTIPPNEWHHVAIVFDAGDIDIYIDGVLDTSGTMSGSLSSSATYSMGEDGYGDYFRGSVDDLRVYYRLLDATEIEEIFVPLPEAWFAADEITGLSDGDPVSSWGDITGNGNDAAQSTGGNQPTWETNEINSLPVVRFDGVDDYLDLSTTLDNNTLTVLVVATRNGDCPDPVNESALIGGSGMNGWGLMVYDSDHATHPDEIFFTRIGSDTAYASTWTPADGPSLISIRYAGANLEFFRNGISDVSPAYTATFSGGASYQIGRLFNSPERSFNGDIAEIIVFFWPLVDAQLDYWHQKLLTKYSL